MECYHFVRRSRTEGEAGSLRVDLQEVLPSEIAPLMKVTPLLDEEVHPHVSCYSWDLEKNTPVKVQ